MKYNDLMPKMKVDPETYVSIFLFLVMELAHAKLQLVEADGVVCKAEPATELPLTQAYYVF